MPTSKTRLRLRWAFIIIDVLLTILTFILAFLHDSLIWLIAVCTGVPFLIYFPAAFWYSRRKSTRVWDRAWAEITYLSVQMGMWMSMIVIGLYYAGPNECARLTYEIGRAQGENPNLSSGPGLDDAVLTSCDLDTIINVLTCVHFVFLAMWCGYIIYVVHQLPMSPRKGFQCSVTKMLRGDYTVPTPATKDMETGSGGTENSSRTGQGDDRVAEDARRFPRIDTTMYPAPDSVGAPSIQGYRSAGTMITLDSTPLSPNSAIVQNAAEPDLPPAYTTTPSPSDGLSPRGPMGMDFDTYLRVQQTRMNEKLAGDRQRRGTPDGTGVNGNGTGEGGDGTSGPSRPRRRSF